MSLKARIEKLEQDLQQLIGDHAAVLRDGGGNDDSNLQYHLGSALCDLQSCYDYLGFASAVPSAGETADQSAEGVIDVA